MSKTIAYLRVSTTDQDLEKNKYQISTLDTNSGILVAEPRKFVIMRDGDKTYGEQTFELRQEGGSVKLRLAYQCEYEVDVYEDCLEGDIEGRRKIRRIENLLMSMINRRLKVSPEDRIRDTREI